MDMSICRKSVCMADDVDNHTRTYTIEPTTTFSDIFLDLIKQKYFPSVFGNDVVWTLFCGDDDLMSWKTKENKLYGRFVDEEPTILSPSCGSATYHQLLVSIRHCARSCLYVCVISDLQVPSFVPY